MPDTNVGPIQTVVAKVKVVARDVLRGQLISVRMSKISSLNAEIKTIQGYIDDQNKEIARSKYALSKIDPANPDAADLTKQANDAITEATTAIKDFTEEIAAVQKTIDEQNAGIAKIESGETKVSLDEMAVLVDQFLVNRGKTQTSTL